MDPQELHVTDQGSIDMAKNIVEAARDELILDGIQSPGAFRMIGTGIMATAIGVRDIRGSQREFPYTICG
jgi:hypothetical protein